MKILHVATDDKFIDHAYSVFEKVYPGANDVLVFAKVEPLKYVKLKPRYIEVGQSGLLLKKSKFPKSVYRDYDLIVFHSLGGLSYPELEKIPKETPTIWVGWGFDYYQDFLSSVSLYLHETQQFFDCNENTSSKNYGFLSVAKNIIRYFFPDNRKVLAVERISVFCPVLPKEYEMVKASRDWKCFPEFASWNYGTLEDHLVKGFEGESVNGTSILVGNSATYTGNHVEAFSLLNKLNLNDRQVIAPISYGNPVLATRIVEMGEMYFSNNFVPLTEFMKIEDYVSIIRQCGYVIMNHVRQQALGNIVIMLYLGARVFVRQENPIYEFLKEAGVVLSTVQELEEIPELINQPLSEIERASNRSIVSAYWGRVKAYERTKDLVEKSLRVTPPG